MAEGNRGLMEFSTRFDWMPSEVRGWDPAVEYVSGTRPGRHAKDGINEVTELKTKVKVCCFPN